jgi:hypothetical protein
MTLDQNFDVLVREAWVTAMKGVFKEGVFKQQREKYKKHCQDLVAAEKAQVKDLECIRKEAETDEQRRWKKIEKFHVQEAQKQEREQQKALKEAARLKKTAEKAALRAEKVALAETRKHAGHQARQKAVMFESASASESDESNEPVVAAVTPVHERPCPCQIQRHMAVELADMGLVQRSPSWVTVVMTGKLIIDLDLHCIDH